MNKFWFLWVPRGLMLLLAAFMLLMSADSFEGNASIGHKLLGFLIHNIPFLILVIIIWLTWNRPLIGGLLFIALGIAFLVFFHTYRRWDTFAVITGPPLVAGILYLIAHFKHLR